MRGVVTIRTLAAVGGLLIATASCGGASRATLDPFTGYWHVHVYTLTIRSDGSGLFQWPLDRYCPPPSPCPLSAAQDQGSANLTLVDLSRGRYFGLVNASNQPSVVPNGPVTLTLGSQDLIRLEFQTHPVAAPYAHYLCGTRTNVEVVNCGA